ncbi:MAG: type II toxin-antitoxin system HicB family antitoxin [Clostridia bacterium]|nr:type II toxin-antitoxin system HicB family antitoxin [Clostridia bacterium]MBR2176128.1 type II toxin-antitoxin system HicB family antitoxin [Clostridia bacterium]
MKLVYPAYFTPLENSDGYCVTFPDLPGCVTQGSSLAEAIEMAVDAASGWVLDELEDGKTAPEASKLNDIKVENADDFVNIVVLDMDAYSEKYGNKAIRKNCTIPSWLNSIAEKNNINFSAVLQSALMEKLGLSS